MELIDREFLKKTLCDKCAEIAGICQKGSCGSTKMIDSMAVVDAVPVVHGHWIDMGDFEQCSACSGTHLKRFETYYGTVTWMKTDYCPNCGAKMDENE